MGTEQINIEYILLACCTCQRPQMLKKTLMSVKNLLLPENIKTEILIVDNDKTGSAKKIVDEFLADSTFKVHYVIEEQRGLASARNRLLEEAINLNATHLMMFDDDEILSEDVLINHISLIKQYQMPVISSGIAINTFEDNSPKFIKNNLIYKKGTTKKTGTIKGSSATDNIFFPLCILKENDVRFSKEYIYMGGEDIDFTQKLSDLGYKIIQNSEAIVYEPVTKSRANLKYIIKRSYFAGFCGPYIAFKNDKCNCTKILYALKTSVVLLFNLLILLPSIICGLTIFFNVLSQISKIVGKIAGSISAKPLDFYKNIDGE